MTILSRRSFVATAAAGAAALGTFSTLQPAANAQLVYTTADWKVADFNHVVHHPARIKQVYDVVPITGGAFLNNIKNSLNGLHFGFGIPMDQIKIVAALHGPANMLNYDDFIRNKNKNGAWLQVNDPDTDLPAVKNPLYASKVSQGLNSAPTDPNNRASIDQDIRMQTLQHRGVKFLSCHTATEEQARGLIAHNKLSDPPEQIVKEMLAHALPGVLVVASMVAAIALLQAEGHYTYLKV